MRDANIEVSGLVLFRVGFGQRHAFAPSRNV